MATLRRSVVTATLTRGHLDEVFPQVNEFLEQLPAIARMKADPEPLGDDAIEVDPTPAHDPVLLAIGAREERPAAVLSERRVSWD
jgi:hypothetical protein